MTDQQDRTRQPTLEACQARIECQRDTIGLLGLHVKTLRMQLDEYEKKDGRFSEPPAFIEVRPQQETSK